MVAYAVAVEWQADRGWPVLLVAQHVIVTDTVAVAWIGSFTAIFVAACGVVVAQINKVHSLVNSRMTELLELTRTSSLAEGKATEQTREKK